MGVSINSQERKQKMLDLIRINANYLNVLHTYLIIVNSPVFIRESELFFWSWNSTLSKVI